MADDNNIEDDIQVEELQPDEQLVIPEVLPLLPVRDVIIFPFMIIPLFVGREKSINAVDMALSKDRLVFLSTQKDISKEDPTPDDLYQYGTVGMIMRMLKLSDGRVKILVQGLARAKINSSKEKNMTYTVEITKIKETHMDKAPVEVEATIRNVRDILEKLASLGKIAFPEVMMVLDNMQDPGRVADLAAANLGLGVAEAQEVLETIDPIKRLNKVYDLLLKEHQVSQMQAKIQTQAREEMDRTQREYYLREQLKAIKNELGDFDEGNDDASEFRDKINKAKMPKEVEKEAIKQADRLEAMHPDAAEATLIRTYLEWLVDLPWTKTTKESLNIKKAKSILDSDHYDLEKVKERILEYLAVRKLNKDTKGPILCFVGPPGVGKTSLGRSIAKAMGRKFVRMSLGGIKDEAEIRGHRRTYVGALPGRIIQGIKQAGTCNPVFMLDEIDKLGSDFRGDPSSALLEVLDPEQNNSFSDHYLNVPFDLSKVMFLTTANQADPIPGPLRDRMETIYIPGYTEEEKIEISKKYIIDRQITENGLTKKLIEIPTDSIRQVITGYTRESGLRNLERQIANLCRKVARQVAEGLKKKTIINADKVSDYLGVPTFIPEDEQEKDEVGVATGLAWTPVGGEILHIETTIMKGRGQLTLTGQLGDVMKESAQAAFSYARSRAKTFKLKEDFYKNIDIHIHVPAGAIPKDGPSAGITIASALISALTKRALSKEITMTGEITLRGKVLPVGGIKEKCLAAMRAGIYTVILPEMNKKDLEEIPDEVRKKMTFHPVAHMDDVLKLVFAKKTAAKKKTKKPGGAKAPKKTVKKQAKKSAVKRAARPKAKPQKRA